MSTIPPSLPFHRLAAALPLPLLLPLPFRPDSGSGGLDPDTRGEYRVRSTGKRRGGAVDEPVGVIECADVLVDDPEREEDGDVDVGSAEGGLEFSLRICSRVRRTSCG